MNVKNNYFSVKNNIETLENAYKNKVELLAVSKKHSVEKIKAVYALGQKAFGESYAQEAIEKIKQLSDLKIQWHFIGPLQSNKTKIVAQNFDWVQSVDSLKLLNRLNKQRPPSKHKLNTLLQVNISSEAQKRGVKTNHLKELCTAFKNLENLRFRGLMFIPEHSTSFEQQLDTFLRCKQIYDSIQKQYNLDTLSMGMSADLEASIKSGSSMVRVGTDIFGKRN